MPKSWALTLFYGLVALVSLPFFVLAWTAFSAPGVGSIGIGSITATLGTTLLVAVGTITVSLLIGVPLALLFKLVTLKAAPLWQALALIPLAFPKYVYAFIFDGLLFQSNLQIRSTLGVILIMGLALYPYVMMLTMDGLSQIGQRPLDVASTLRQTGWQRFRRVLLPLLLPWIGGSAILVGLEAVADFGAVSMYSVPTLSTAIYEAWYGHYSFAGAAKLSLILFVLAYGLIRIHRYFLQRQNPTESPSPLRKWTPPFWLAALFYVILGGLVMLAVVLPVAQLLIWAFAAKTGVTLGILNLLGKTLSLGLLAALLITTATLLGNLVLRHHKGRLLKQCGDLINIGYGVPGTVLAVGFFIPMAWIDQQLGDSVPFLLTQSLLVVLLGYLVRFYAVSFTPISSCCAGLKPQFEQLAKTMAISPSTQLRQIYLPLLKPGISSSVLLICIEVMKELPMTLMTRPFGWDTLATALYQWTSEGLWEQAALPALLIVGISCVPMLLLGKKWLS